MATLPKEHNEIYFDALIRTNKADSLLALIKATYFAYQSDTSNVKEEIAKRLENAYNLLRKNVKGSDSGSGTYSGSLDQFQSQYTLGHEMGIWADSDLHLTKLALKVAKDEITVKEYLRIIFSNYIQPVDGKIVHPLYMLLNYMQQNSVTEVHKDTLSYIYGVKCDGGNANGLINLLIDTEYFTYKSGVLTLNNKYSIEELILKCNTKYLSNDGFLKANEELNDPENYYQYLSTENKNYLFKSKNVNEIYKLFQKWIINDMNPERLTNANGYGSNLAKIFAILEKKRKIQPDSLRCSDILYYEYIRQQYESDEEAKSVDASQHYPARAAFAHYVNFIKQVLIFGEEYIENRLTNVVDNDGLFNKNYWLCSANSSIYNHDGSFKKFGEIDWAQDKHFRKANIGDVVFIYCSSPIKQVKYKCVITQKDITKSNKLDDKEFWTNPLQEDDYDGLYIKFKLVKEVDDARLKYENLLIHGLIAAPQGACKLVGNKASLAKYIDSIFENFEFVQEEQEELTTDISFNINGKGKNLVVYGTPGCGKSYHVENELLKNYKLLEDNTRERVIRTTFYQDYTNTDFIGQILPYIEKDEDGKDVVTYKFNPGPFALALKEALSCDGQEVALVIEELNRGNAPAIFGDIFQLLDRDENGISKYAITNVNLIDYLNKELGTNLTNIKIPGNLFIYATMNTSDQNVFTLDTAFKRRWEFKKIKNEFKPDHSFAEKFIPGMQLTWKDFVKSINQYMTNDQSIIGAEDKQIGVYFIDESGMRQEVLDVQTDDEKEEFAYKIFEYLWDDVAKFDRRRWFRGEIKTLDDLIEKYIKEGIKVFNEEVFGSELYNNGTIKKESESSETV